jgi:hypothetical protein
MKLLLGLVIVLASSVAHAAGPAIDRITIDPSQTVQPGGLASRTIFMKSS